MTLFKPHSLSLDAVLDIAILPMTVLVVDDNEAAAHSLAKLLTLKGHSVIVAYSGESAIARVKEHSFGVVLLDIGLPDLDGFAVATALRSNGYVGGLIALSGYSQKEYMEKAATCGFDYYAIKPISVKVVESYFRALQEKQPK